MTNVIILAGNHYWLPAILNNRHFWRLAAAFEIPTRNIRDDKGGDFAPFIIPNLNNRQLSKGRIREAQEMRNIH